MNKFYPLDRLAPLIQAKKQEGQSIVLANGCFDMIHVGHIRYLRESKAQGDILVVALNSDASVRTLKGKGRPILDQVERIEILEAFSFVDYITVFDEATVDRVLLTLKPDVHAKGADYTEESVPERDTVLGYGGKVAITGGPKIRWTSDIIREIIRKAEKTKTR